MAGAGGTDSCDWAEMLVRMYKGFAQRRGFAVSVVDSTQGPVVGLKSATIKVEG